MRSRLLAAVVCVSACTPRPTPSGAPSLPPDECPPRTLALGAFGPVQGLVGEPARVDFGLELFDCHLAVPTLMPQATSAVLDPENQPVASTVTVSPGDPDAHPWESLPRPAESGFAEMISATLTFTPTRYGSYHLAVRFEPDYGTAQADLAVLTDHRPAPFQSTPMPYTCNRFEVAGEVTLCLDYDQRLLHVFFHGTETATLSALSFAVEDGRLWWVEVGFLDVVHLADLSATGQLTELASLNLEGQPIARGFIGVLANLSATGDHLMLSSAGLLQELVYRDGGLVTGPLITPPGEGFTAIVYRPDAGVLFTLVQHDAGVVSQSVCQLTDTAGGARCQAATPIACDGHVLWSQDHGTLTAWTVAPDGGVTSRSSFIGDVELIRGDVPFRRDPGSVGVELVDLDPLPQLAVYGLPGDALTDGGGALYVGCTSRIYWERNGDQIDYLLR
ncbi:MAG: hypothetical protein QM723_31855 [Myxococcaceae bacterium]